MPSSAAVYSSGCANTCARAVAVGRGGGTVQGAHAHLVRDNAPQRRRMTVVTAHYDVPNCAASQAHTRAPVLTRTRSLSLSHTHTHTPTHTHTQAHARMHTHTHSHSTNTRATTLPPRPHAPAVNRQELSAATTRRTMETSAGRRAPHASHTDAPAAFMKVHAWQDQAPPRTDVAAAAAGARAGAAAAGARAGGAADGLCAGTGAEAAGGAAAGAGATAGAAGRLCPGRSASHAPHIYKIATSAPPRHTHTHMHTARTVRAGSFASVQTGQTHPTAAGTAPDPAATPALPPPPPPAPAATTGLASVGASAPAATTGLASVGPSGTSAACSSRPEDTPASRAADPGATPVIARAGNSVDTVCARVCVAPRRRRCSRATHAPATHAHTQLRGTGAGGRRGIDAHTHAHAHTKYQDACARTHAADAARPCPPPPLRPPRARPSSHRRAPPRRASCAGARRR